MMYSDIICVTLTYSVYLRLLDILVHDMVPEGENEQPDEQEWDDKLV